MGFREPTADEARLLGFLLEAAAARSSSSETCDLLVENMPDGGMGSLRLRPADREIDDRAHHSTLAACSFRDADDVVVIATLYGNRSGLAFELDVWKVDFSPLTRIPLEFQLLDATSPTLPR